MKIKEQKDKIIKKSKYLQAGIATALPTVIPCNIAHADQEAEDIVKEILNWITQIFRYVGILLLVWSIGMMIFAFKNDDADSKQRAMMLLVVSIMLIVIKDVANAILLKTGENGTGGMQIT